MLQILIPCNHTTLIKRRDSIYLDYPEKIKDEALVATPATNLLLLVAAAYAAYGVS